MKKSTPFVFILIYLVSFVFSLLAPKRPFWYAWLNKPALTPSSKTIGTIWGILYVFIALAVSIIYNQHGFRKGKPFYLLFIINFFVNQAFGHVFFKAKSTSLAAVDTILVSLTAIFLNFLARSLSLASAVLLLPYSLWSSFATYLAVKIYWLNR